MRIRFVDLKRQLDNIRPEIESAFDQVMENTAFILGPAAREFEQSFAEFIGAGHCIGCGNGTDALVLALRAADIGPGDEVITTANTFVATSEAVRLVGAKPVFIDPDEGTYLMSAEKVEKAISADTRAVIPVHLYGQTVDMAPIMELARDHDIIVIEDAAQAHGAKNRGNRAGSFGDLACFSFYPGKNLGAYGDAGAILTSNPEFAEKLRLLRDHGAPDKYHHIVDAHNSRLDGLQAAVLNVKLRHLEKWNDSRRRIAAHYMEQLKDTPEVKLPGVEPFNEPVWHLFVVRVPHRDEIRELMNERGIDTGIHYPVALHEQPVYKDLGYAPEDFPIAHRNAPLLLSLPIFPEMTEEECSYVCDNLKEILEELT